MEISMIYDLLNNKLLKEKDEIIRKNSSECIYFKDELKEREKLEQRLDEEEKHSLRVLYQTIDSKIEYIHYNMDIKILNIGIKIGMELQKAFTDLDIL